MWALQRLREFKNKGEDMEEQVTAGILGTVPQASPLDMALGEHSAQLDKLHGLVSSVASRLEPVRVSLPPMNGPQENAAAPVTSAITTQVHAHTSVVKKMQEVLSHLLQELEI